MCTCIQTHAGFAMYIHVCLPTGMYTFRIQYLQTFNISGISLFVNIHISRDMEILKFLNFHISAIAEILEIWKSGNTKFRKSQNLEVVLFVK